MLSWCLSTEAQEILVGHHLRNYITLSRRSLLIPKRTRIPNSDSLHISKQYSWQVGSLTRHVTPRQVLKSRFSTTVERHLTVIRELKRHWSLHQRYLHR